MTDRSGSPGYRLVPHTSEVGVWLGGRTWKEFYENAARGLLAVYGVEGLRGPHRIRRRTALRGRGPEDLLVDWLNELVFLISTELWVPTRILAVAARRDRLQARLSGPRLAEGDVKAEVKAATYHGLKVARRGGLWTATVILDV